MAGGGKATVEAGRLWHPVEEDHLQRYPAENGNHGAPVEVPVALPEPTTPSGPTLAVQPLRLAETPGTSPKYADILVSGRAQGIAVEQYRRLAAKLHEIQNDRGIKTLIVTSALPKEGKTLTVTNLALTQSESYQQRVLLIDADLRRPSVHDLLNLSTTTGFSEFLRPRLEHRRSCR